MYILESFSSVNSIYWRFLFADSYFKVEFTQNIISEAI